MKGRLKAQPGGLTIEVRRFADAPWAPRSTGVAFDWAWRVQGPGLYEPIVGACCGARRLAEQLAKDAAARIPRVRVRAGNFQDGTDYSAHSQRRAAKHGGNSAGRDRRIERAWKRAAAKALLLAALIACGGDPYDPPLPPIKMIL